ncbi:MAG: phenylalanine--tRNA ligase subunit alpha [Methanobacterium sp.]|uniref:phenylalanine--tRNA ligase subunit alpha n=1 Tax=Methanobacterium sp. TaxID=2164 RepID=UPI003D654B44|nr:phenylalanine--tRNA ligase subunit alpha [Methanobacterium sp.]
MLQNIINELTQYEKMVLKGLESFNYETTPENIVESQNLNIKSVMSAAGALESKGLIEVQKDVNEFISLSITGKGYAKEGLPERRILKTLNDEDQIPMKDLSNKADLDSSEVKIAIGWLLQKKWATIDKGIVTITEAGRNAVSNEYSDELLLEKLLEVNKLLFFNPSKLIKEGFDLLKKRKGILDVKKEHKYYLKVTKKGKQLLEMGIDIKEDATQLTHEQLKTGSWKKLNYRGYDVQAEHPDTFPGKMHPLQRTIEDIRQIFLKMGFTESSGTILESAFWNFDCLFQPQDHAAREMQDTFYIKNPKNVNLPSDELVENVRMAHENGGCTGSEGWGYLWDVEVAKQSVLRTHTTCVSARYLAENKPPLKMFSVGRVFRRETITYKHLPEFHQVEGIVAANDITFKNLLGILKEFYHKLGFEVRFRPAYFPYTYLSVECEIYLPDKETWIELGGAGMFRPEVLEPIGVKTPVAAFGLGIERLAMMRLDIKDIRMLYKSDIGWLRKLPVKLD